MMGGMTDGPERFQKLTSYGVIPAPSGAGAVVIHAEEGRDCRVVLRVIRAADKTDKIAIVTLARCMQSVFEYPNDEAYWHDPRGTGDGGRPGYGFYEVLSSTWPQRLAAYNRHAFPDRTPAYWGRLFSSAAMTHLVSSWPTTSRWRSPTATSHQPFRKRSTERVGCPQDGERSAA
jgi:hypothetical protein